MTRKQISTSSPYEKIAGFSRAIVQGDWVFASGCTGYDPERDYISADPAEQARDAFKLINWLLAEAGFGLADVVRIVVYLADRSDFGAVAPVLGEHFRDIRPANTTVEARLVDPRMKVEIEITAYRGG
jgi:enamine deaminase RidA (YjgF/YER057c/UK114 family)